MQDRAYRNFNVTLQQNNADIDNYAPRLARKFAHLDPVTGCCLRAGAMKPKPVTYPQLAMS